MPCYFFHVSVGDRILLDEEGVALPSRQAAREEALAVIRDLSAAEERSASHRWERCLLRVVDEIGRQLLCLAIGRSHLVLVPAEPLPTSCEPPVAVEDFSTELARSLGLLLERARRLRARNRQLREELSAVLIESQHVRFQALAAVSHARLRAALGGDGCVIAAGATRPQLVVIQGGRE